MIIQITDREYKLLCDWWEQRHFQVLPRSMLPDTTYVVYIDNKPIIGTCLYLPKDPHCTLAMTAWYTANPDTTYEERFEGLTELEDWIERVAKENKMTGTISFTSKSNLAKNLVLNSYVPIEQGTFLVKKY